MAKGVLFYIKYAEIELFTKYIIDILIDMCYNIMNVRLLEGALYTFDD